MPPPTGTELNPAVLLLSKCCLRPSELLGKAKKRAFHDDGTLLSVEAIPHGFEPQLGVERLGCHGRGHSQDRNAPLDRCSFNFGHQCSPDAATLTPRVDKDSSHHLAIEA